MQVSLAKVLAFICEPVHPLDPHPGQSCDMYGPGTRCSICTGQYELQDPYTGEWVAVPLPGRRHFHE